MAWRTAHCITTAQREVNNAHPGRSIKSDGTIGDAKHASRSSDHNPWVILAGMGIVTAADFTNDPKVGFSSEEYCDYMRQRGKNGDARIKYVISNRKIASSINNWSWRPYNGSNPHDKHGHVSFSSDYRLFDDVDPFGWGKRVWTLGERILSVEKPYLFGADVKKIQEMVGAVADGVYGPATADLVRAWQERNGLSADGDVGPITLKALLSPKPVDPMTWLQGAIRDLYNTLPLDIREAFGPPLSPENKCPDGEGVYQHFAGGGSIFWHPAFGACAVWGAIRSTWAALGWESGEMGYPRTSEFTPEGGTTRQVHFENGILDWNPAHGQTWLFRYLNG